MKALRLKITYKQYSTHNSHGHRNLWTPYVDCGLQTCATRSQLLRKVGVSSAVTRTTVNPPNPVGWRKISTSIATIYAQKKIKTWRHFTDRLSTNWSTRLAHCRSHLGFCFDFVEMQNKGGRNLSPLVVVFRRPRGKPLRNLASFQSQPVRQPPGS